MRPGARAKGFSMLELLLALGIAAGALVTVSGGLRIGLGAWQQGERRTAELDRERGLVLALERALTGAFPYQFTGAGESPTRLLFEGRPDRLAFVTLTPPLPPAAPAAFSAVGVSVEAEGLALRQQVLPNRLALDHLPSVVVDRATTAVRFRYLGQDPGTWQDTWDTTRDEGLPRAVEITLVAGASARRAARTFTVPLPVNGPR